ncbi:MAG TPA: c-type cytochrome [Ideonella sp.]|uniref:c-type cytochrome n=1 Tax=Ideonella sp. TaxID=1929293 RepID=UPI002E33B8EE|nr:c-type cytochrome [Ideonella sp.]HEX5683814.1 c-type cytochrome [Ideonella sp.]
MNRTLATVVLTVAAALVLAVVVGVLVVTRGLYDVGATTQHTQPVYGLLETTMKYAVRVRAANIVPPPPQPGLIARGATCYRDHCVQCHGGPGIAPGPVGMSMQPLPGPLLDAARRWHAREIYWITRHGIRMSGMPAWSMRLSEEDIWAVVGFIERMPELSPTDYGEQMASVQADQCTLPSSGLGNSDARLTVPPSDARAQLALRQYACVSCHTIPGVTGSDTRVGSPLDGLARRTLIAGRLPNTADNLVRWIQSPQQVKPGTAMPDLGVTEDHARLMASYLSGLH